MSVIAKCHEILFYLNEELLVTSMCINFHILYISDIKEKMEINFAHASVIEVVFSAPSLNRHLLCSQ